MRSISQLVVAVLMVAAVIVATAIYAYLSATMLSRYNPSSTSISRVGGVDVNLIGVCSEIICGGNAPCPCPDAGYRFAVSIKLVNLGSSVFKISPKPGVVRPIYPKIVVLVKGGNKGEILSCYIPDRYMIYPGEIKEVTGICFISNSKLKELFGTPYPPFDKVKENTLFLFMSLGKGVPPIL